MLVHSSSTSAMQNLSKPPPHLVLPQGAVAMRIKSSAGIGERLSQTKSMVIPDHDPAQKPVRHPSFSTHTNTQYHITSLSCLIIPSL